MKNSLMSDEVAFNLAHAQKNLINLDDSDDESEEEDLPEDLSNLDESIIENSQGYSSSVGIGFKNRSVFVCLRPRILKRRNPVHI